MSSTPVSMTFSPNQSFESSLRFGVSIRAVRADRDLWATLGHLMKPGGVVLWFRSESDAAGPDPVFFFRSFCSRPSTS